MMKTLRVIKKNLLLLGRSKGSALVVLFAPLLIVLIIGVSFTDTTEQGLPVGVHAPDDTNLTNQYIDTLESENEVKMYNSERECTEAITQGFVVTCIVFPPGFEVDESRRQEITFHIDESRINLAHQLIANIGVDIEEASEEVSREITNNLLNIVSTAEQQADSSSTELVQIKADMQGLKNTVENASSSTNSLDVEEEDISINTGKFSNLEDDFQSLKDDAQEAVTTGNQFLEDSNYNGTSKQNFEEDLNTLDSAVSSASNSIGNFSDAISNLEQAQDAVSSINDKLSDAQTTQTELLDTFQTLQNDIDDIVSDIDSVRERQDAILSSIDSFEFQEAEDIVTPIGTNIETVNANNSQITFNFPYLLMLVVLFVGIMLSSTLIFIEKDSKAFFRNFTTPTKTSFLTTMTYLTSILILIVQVFLIILAAFYLLNIPVFQNWEYSLLILFLSMTVFVLIGMLIGHLFNTSEAITMGSITLSSIFLFLSNLVLPIETFSQQVRNILTYNPYILSSEGLRKTMLLEADHTELTQELTLLVAYIVILFILVIITQKISKLKYFKKMNLRKRGSGITINGKNVHNLKDLKNELEKTGSEEYEESKSKINSWLKDRLKKPSLAEDVMDQEKEEFVQEVNKRLGNKSAPTMNNTKEEMKKWLDNEGIDYDDDMLKKELYELIKEKKN